MPQIEWNIILRRLRIQFHSDDWEEISLQELEGLKYLDRHLRKPFLISNFPKYLRIFVSPKMKIIANKNSISCKQTFIKEHKKLGFSKVLKLMMKCEK